MKPRKKKYKDSNELGREYCEQSNCSACKWTDENGEPNGFGCNGQDEFIDTYEHLIKEERQ